MRNIVKRIMGRGSEDQKGFTLIELLIVVGIIVALAAVIIPLVIQFAGRGDEGAKAAEFDTLQTSIDAMMTDLGVTALTADGDILFPVVNDATGDHLGSTASIFKDDGGVVLDFTEYMRDIHTQYCYLWGANGGLTQSDLPIDSDDHDGSDNPSCV